MNSNENTEPSEVSDESVSELLTPLRQITPDQDTTARIRAVVDRELQQDHSSTRQRPWWSRSVAIPLPALIAAGLLFAVLLTKTTFLPREQETAVTEVRPQKQTTSAEHPKEAVAEITKSAADDEWQAPHITTQETYLCGLGRIGFTTTYSFQETLQ